jgi:tungstate transport system ATP-binding protein
MNRQPSTQDTPRLLPLVLEQVGFVRRGQALLDGVSLRFDTTGKTVILGPNGAGKSLLMRICHGLLEPTSGRVRWSGSASADPVAVRRSQAMVFQRPVMLRRSALDNVAYALSVQGVARGEAAMRATEALDHFGLAALASRPARVLSGGEQQRLALARAWVLEPEILFLDEPTASLDPAATRAVEEAVADFHEAGIRIVMTTHDLGQAHRLADDIVFLCGGRVLEHASAAHFFAAPQSSEALAFLRGELVW